MIYLVMFVYGNYAQFDNKIMVTFFKAEDQGHELVSLHIIFMTKKISNSGGPRNMCHIFFPTLITC